jgi:hypothetical protein
MEPFSAAAVYETARSFEQLRATCNLVERFGKVKFAGSEISPNQMESIELLPTRTRMELPADWQKSVLSILSSVEKHCESIGLKLAAEAARDYRVELESGKIKTYSDASEAIGTLDKIITLQLRENLFMFISPDRAALYAKPQLFGEAVNKRFSGCQYDIEESGNCYAAGRGTACAFHLMRVMEVAVQEFGTSLGIALTNEKNWQNILDEINKAIRALSGKHGRTIALSQAAAHLYNVKVAWRNPTMHPKITYTLEEAADLISTVKAFMNELAQVVQ